MPHSPSVCNVWTLPSYILLPACVFCVLESALEKWESNNSFLQLLGRSSETVTSEGKVFIHKVLHKSHWLLLFFIALLVGPYGSPRLPTLTSNNTYLCGVFVFSYLHNTLHLLPFLEPEAYQHITTSVYMTKEQSKYFSKVLLRNESK